MNGEDKGDSGVETQNSESNADEECDPLGPNCYYDKSKSFFDNISCDDTRFESLTGFYSIIFHELLHRIAVISQPLLSYNNNNLRFLSSRKANDKSGGSVFPR